uniref:Uncharacterized protein n=1 Tax=Amphimedon queenslandica TaxID=400682 RepID=A0A1X7UQU6_AMPQE
MKNLLLHLTSICTGIKKCIFDYRPVYRFWLFAFQRFNGILGSYHTNQKSVEIQLMHKFLDNISIATQAETDCYLINEGNDILPLLQWTPFRGTADATINFTFLTTEDIVAILSLPSTPIKPSHELLLQNLPIHPCPHFQRSFDANTLHYLHQSYSIFIPCFDSESVLPAMFEEFRALKFWRDRVNSKKHPSCIVYAKWTKYGRIIDKENDEVDARAGVVINFFSTKYHDK